MTVTKYLWDDLSDNLLMESDELGATKAVYAYEPEVHGGLISQRRGSTDSYYHFDGLGSTRELTDSSETVTDTNLCDAWGVNVDSTGATENPFRFVGELGYYFDADSGSYYARERTYRPIVARWISRDPLAQEGRDVGPKVLHRRITKTRPFVWTVRDRENLYAYARNNPTNKVDPSGLTSCDEFVSSIMTNAITVEDSLTPQYDLAAIIACRYVPTPHRYVLAVNCGKYPYFRPPRIDGFCPQLSMGGQGADLYRHLAWSMSAKLQGLTTLSEIAEKINCRELRESCCCRVPPSQLVAPSARCLENQSEVIADIIGRRLGQILKQFTEGTINAKIANNLLWDRLCRGRCTPDDADHCCD